jgi:site-specific DNA-methyltransferase (adenine-specific)
VSESPAEVPSEKKAYLRIFEGDNLSILRDLPSSSVDLAYFDPPFNTGHRQERLRIRTTRDETGDRTGFKGHRYRTQVMECSSYDDRFEDYLAFLEPRLIQAHRVLKPTGSLFLHLDYREVHYVKVALDGIFGRRSFINEIIWAYDYGARSARRWSAKHDNILWYAKTPTRYSFNLEEVDRIAYMAPALVGEKKAKRGKTPTDTWWHTIVSPNGREKTGYPTQKPRGIIDRIVKVHSNPGDVVLDAFAGSGTLGESALLHGRNALLIDCSASAISVMRERLSRFDPEFFGVADPVSSF